MHYRTQLRTLLQKVNQRTHRSNSDAVVTTVFGFAEFGGVREKCTETPVRTRSAIFKDTDVRETSSRLLSKDGALVFTFMVSSLHCVL